MVRIAVKVAVDGGRVKAKVADNRALAARVVQAEQAVLVERHVPVAANQRVHLSQLVRVVAQCHRVRNIVRVGAVDK